LTNSVIFAIVSIYLVPKNKNMAVPAEDNLPNPNLATKNEEVRSSAEYLQSFEKNQLALETTLSKVQGKADQTTKRLHELADDSNSLLRGVLTGQIARHQRVARLITGDLEFLRPSSEEDVAYRLSVYDGLPGAIRQAVPLDTPLRFHGTRLSASRDIISSGEISSSEDREGISTSDWGGGGMISVTRAENIRHSVQDYVHLLDRDCTVPPGCIFVLRPATPDEAATTEIMGNVYFGEQPERLVGIMTAPENVSLVQGWSTAAGIDPNKVGEFFAVAEGLGKLI
jgi:hypothetical protein